MSLDVNKAVIQRFFEIHDSGDLALVDAVVSEDYVSHMPGSADIEGPEQLKAHIEETRLGFPDIHHTVEDVVAERDTVAARVTVRGTHQGEYGGIPPTGKQIVFTVMGMLRVARSKVVESWFDYDALGFMQQLGMELRPKS